MHDAWHSVEAVVTAWTVVTVVTDVTVQGAEAVALVRKTDSQ